MSDVTINYGGSSIATMDGSGTKTLKTAGKYCASDIEVAYTASGASITNGVVFNQVSSSGQPTEATFYGPTIVKNAMRDNTVLKTLHLSSYMTLILNNAFYGCTGLDFTSIDLSGVTVYNNAFCGCTGLGGDGGKFKIYGDSDTKLGTSNSTNTCRVFQDCAFSKVWLEDAGAIYAISSGGPFYGCDSLTDIYTPLSSRPSGWNSNFIKTGSSATATVHYNTTEAQFDAL